MIVPSWLAMVTAVLLFAHGTWHVLIAVGYSGLGVDLGMPYKTRFLAGRLELGEEGTRGVALGFLLAGILFLAIAWGAMGPSTWWRSLLPVAATISLALMLLDWPLTRIGAAIDVVVLAALVVSAGM
jgi:hypothetical protein